MISYNYHIYFMLIVGMNIHVHALFHVIKFNLLLKSLCIISMEKKSGYFFFYYGKIRMLQHMNGSEMNFLV